MPACFFMQVDARARPLDLAADAGRHGEPVAVGAGEVLDRRVDGAVLLDELGHDVVDRLEAAGVVGGLPGREGEDVVARSRLRLGRDGQQVLVALRGDVVDRDLDLVLRAPFLAQRLGRVVGAGHPVVPEADASLPAACAPRTWGIAMTEAAVGAKKWRRVSPAVGHCAIPPHAFPPARLPVLSPPSLPARFGLACLMAAEA